MLLTVQYGLVNTAERLGWPRERTLVIDDDLGVSGASCEGRFFRVHELAPLLWRPSWKNQKPLQWVPVIFLARALRDRKTWP